MTDDQDLRVYTIWRAEISHFKTQHMSYRKTGTEVSFFLSHLTFSPSPLHESPWPPEARQDIEADNQWEILGDLALRLQHKEEAKDAFQRCLDSKFSAKALLKLLEMYSAEGDLQRTLNIAIRLTTYHHRYVPLCSFPSFLSLLPSSLLSSLGVQEIDADDRWYMDASYPSMVAHYLYKLGLIHGHAKIQYTLLSMVSTSHPLASYPLHSGASERLALTFRTYLEESSRSCRDT